MGRASKPDARPAKPRNAPRIYFGRKALPIIRASKSKTSPVIA
jgi:hypothetical protein